MAFNESGLDGVLTVSPTEAVLVPTPPVGRRLVRGITIANGFTSGVYVSVAIASGSTRRGVWQGVIPGKSRWHFGGNGELLVLTASRSVVASGLTNAPMQPDFSSHWGDAS